MAVLLSGTGAVAFCLVAPSAHAEAATAAAESAAPEAAPPAAAAPEDIIVTGTRVVRDGYSAPTPVSVISTEEINREAPANISDFVNTLPAVRGAGTAANSNGALSNGGAGINTVNLRNLGANRTLVLVDGQRSVPSTNTGSVDVNTIPQDLIERVEVVTGGASSAYGSDAVSGVVNFILNKKFSGIKANIEHGVTTYGDAANYKVGLTAGTSFADGKGHVTVSGEYFNQLGVQSINRSWNSTGFFRINNPQYSAAACANSTPATICYPEYLVTANAGVSSFAPGGLVTFGPLKGIYFGNINPATGYATVNNLAFGAVQPGSQWMVGGDQLITSASHDGSATLQPAEKRKSLFGRLSYQFSPAFNVFAQFSYNTYRGQSFYQQTGTTATSATSGILIQSDNAFLPPSVKALMTTNNLTSIRLGTGNVFIKPQGSDNTRDVYRYVAGVDGSFEFLKRDWKWNAYYQRGMTKTNELLTNAWELSRFALATDAVVVTSANVGSSGLAIGSVACRSTLIAPTNGCAPINVIGIQPNQTAGVNYITHGGLNPLRLQRLTQDVAAVSFSTNNLFELPAGPVSLAFGGEYRKEGISGFVDPIFQPGRDAANCQSSEHLAQIAA